MPSVILPSVDNMWLRALPLWHWLSLISSEIPNIMKGNLELHLLFGELGNSSSWLSKIDLKQQHLWWSQICTLGSLSQLCSPLAGATGSMRLGSPEGSLALMGGSCTGKIPTARAPRAPELQGLSSSNSLGLFDDGCLLACVECCFLLETVLLVLRLAC